MRFETVCDALGFSWDQVVIAFWARYPNPYTKHVLTEDILKRELREDGTLYTCRLLMKTNSIPSWAQNLMPAKRVPIIEESIVDPQNKTFTTYCRNVTHKNIMETTERVVYTDGVDSDGKAITNCNKRFWVSSQWIFPTRNIIERFGAQRWVKNVAKTRDGFNHVLEQIYTFDASDEAAPLMKSVFPVHPFILEKRKILREKAALMGHKAKERLGKPIEHAKEKLEKTRENAKVTIEKTRENAKVTIEKTRENAKVTIGSAQDNLKEKFSFRGAEG